jgi:hypothetical protein
LKIEKVRPTGEWLHQATWVPMPADRSRQLPATTANSLPPPVESCSVLLLLYSALHRICCFPLCHLVSPALDDRGCLHTTCAVAFPCSKRGDTDPDSTLRCGRKNAMRTVQVPLPSTGADSIRLWPPTSFPLRHFSSSCSASPSLPSTGKRVLCHALGRFSRETAPSHPPVASCLGVGPAESSPPSDFKPPLPSPRLDR